MAARDANAALLERVLNGDKTAEDALVRINTGLVTGVAKRFLGRGQDFDDLMQMGYIGLIRAARLFDPSRGTAFSTYAVPYIAGEIKRFFRDDGMIKVSREVKRRCALLMRERERYAAEHGEEPRLHELCERCGIGEEEAREALGASESVCSLDEPLGDGTGLRRGDAIPDTSCADAAAGLIVKEAVESLGGRERAVMYLRGMCGMTQTDTARRLGLTQTTVSRTEKKAREKLRTVLES